jgi:hypothetical protein
MGSLKHASKYNKVHSNGINILRNRFFDSLFMRRFFYSILSFISILYGIIINIYINTPYNMALR